MQFETLENNSSAITIYGKQFEKGATVIVDGVEVSGEPELVVGLYMNDTGFAIEVQLTNDVALHWLETVHPTAKSFRRRARV